MGFFVVAAVFFYVLFIFSVRPLFVLHYLTSHACVSVCSCDLLCYVCEIQLGGNGFSIFLVANLLFFTLLHVRYSFIVLSATRFVYALLLSHKVRLISIFFFRCAGASNVFDLSITKAKTACKFGFKKGKLLWSFSLHDSIRCCFCRWFDCLFLFACWN